MKLLLSTAMLLVVGFSSSVSGQTWRIGDDQSFPLHITELPQTRQKSILRALEASLQERAKEFELDQDERMAAKNELLVRQMATPNGPITLVQGWGLSLCGGTGNCKVWVLGRKDRLLLDGQAYRFKLLRDIHRGLPSIMTFSSGTADGVTLTSYSFDGSQYRRKFCAIERTELLGKVYSKPRIDYMPCGK